MPRPREPKPKRPTPRARTAKAVASPPEPSPQAMRRLFQSSGLRLSPPQLDQFWKFHQLLRRRNADLDLTRLHGFEAMVLKHYVDCALVATLVDLPSPLLDLGTGAGFPGIPLKIVRPDVRLVLAEGRGKRVAFLEEAVRELGLRDVEIVPHRIGTRFETPVRGVITRAVESIPATLARLLPWLAPGARVLFMKGPGVEAELAQATRDRPARFGLVRDQPYTIPGTQHARRLVVFERLEDAPGCDARDILSAANPTLKLLRSLLTGRGIRKHGQALVAGMRPILEVLCDFPEAAVAWVSAGNAAPPPSEAPAGLAWYRLSPDLFRELDTAGTGTPLLLVRVPGFETWSDDDWPPGCTLFVPFQDPENVGAVIRTAAALGAARVVLLREAAHPFHPRALRAAGSAVLRLPLLSGPRLSELAPRGAPLLALQPGGSDLGGVTFPESFGLVAGLEGPGLPAGLQIDTAIGIPMRPGSESLNAAAATAIALYVWSRGRSDC